MGRRARTVLLLMSIGLLGANVGGGALVSFPGGAPGEGVKLQGNLYRRDGAGPFPAMVLLHGCGGVTRSVHSWAGWLRDQGYVALVADSFAPRGVFRICGGRGRPDPKERARDALGARGYLRTLGFVDGDRIGVMGWSHGARTTLETIAEAGKSFQAAVALYPGCRGFAPPRETPPLLLLLGEADDWTPSKPCVELAESLRSAGAAVAVTVYPQAHHGFDIPEAGVVGRRVPDARGGRGATVRYDPAAAADAHERLRAFLTEHLGHP